MASTPSPVERKPNVRFYPRQVGGAQPPLVYPRPTSPAQPDTGASGGGRAFLEPGAVALFEAAEDLARELGEWTL